MARQEREKAGSFSENLESKAREEHKERAFTGRSGLEKETPGQGGGDGDVKPAHRLDGESPEGVPKGRSDGETRSAGAGGKEEESKGAGTRLGAPE